MAPSDITVSLKRHSHPVLGGLSLAAFVLSCVALAKACPPVPAPAAAPVTVVDKPLVVPAAAPIVAPLVEAKPTEVLPVASVLESK